MEDEILNRLERIEKYTILSSKSMLTLDDAILLLGLSKSTIYKLTSSRVLPHYKNGKYLYFDKGELETWMRQNRIGTASEAEAAAESYCLNHKR